MILTFKSIKSKASSVEIKTIYLVAVLNMWYIHVHICVHVCVEGHICVYTPEVSVDYLAQSHFTFFFLNQGLLLTLELTGSERLAGC